MAGSYEKLELLGSGSYGKAWLVNCPSKDRQAVMKEIRLDCLSDKEVGQALVEVKVLARCRHVNIVSYCEAFVNSGCLHIVMEFADSGDMQKKILEQRGIHFDNEVILDWFIQICFALKYLHSENILHRDLKPQNLFLTSDGMVKVGDFGIARILQDTADHALTAIGTPYYLSPEICQRKPYNSKSDMWSAGCVLYELCCLRVPFQAPNLPLLVLKILEDSYDPLPSHYGAVLEDLVEVLLKTNPSQRPSAEQVLSVPALQPQVKVTYRKCIGHKQQRHRQRALSREAASPSVLNARKADHAAPCHQTYTVNSPLLRHLSVATPKLKAAIKRQRSVQSAEAVAAVKRHRKSSKPPVLNLQEAFLSLSPSSQHSPDSEFPDRIKWTGGSPVPEKPDEDFNNSDDVFENDNDITKYQNPNFTPSRENSPENQGKVTAHNEASHGCVAVIKNEDSGLKCRVSDSISRKDQCLVEFQNLVKREGKSNEKCARISPNRQQWETYTVAESAVDPRKEKVCSECKRGVSSQGCLNHALFTATALSCTDKPSACRHLLRFLVTHLGSDLSLHLSSLIHSAVHAKGDYSAVERSLDKRSKSYLPAVFLLLGCSDCECGVPLE